MNIIDRLKLVARRVTNNNHEQEFEVYDFMTKGRIDIAQIYLFGLVDNLYACDKIHLTMAKRFCLAIDPSSERARMFPQVTTSC